jgi:hypothetical protein
MGIFRKVSTALNLGLGDDRLLRRGVPATALILAADNTRFGTSGTMGANPIYKLRLRVSVPGAAPYDVEHTQWTMNSAPPEVGDVVNVRVDPGKPDELIIDWRNPPRTAKGGGASIAEILSKGDAGHATVREIFETGVVAEDNGDPVVGFVLALRADSREPWDVRFAHRVPASIRPRIAVGQEYPVKFLPEDPNEVAIDWSAVTF